MPSEEKRGDRATWGKQQEWLMTYGPKRAGALRPFISNLTLAQPDVDA
jgi:hypothetical protein